MKLRCKANPDIVVEAISFPDFVAHGILSGGNIVNHMPWSFRYKNLPVSHENDSCYIVGSPILANHFTPNHLLLSFPHGLIKAQFIVEVFKEFDPISEEETNNPIVPNLLTKLE